MSHDVEKILNDLFEEVFSVEKQDAYMPSFETEQDALAFAQRVATLKEGAIVRFKAADGTERKGTIVDASIPVFTLAIYNPKSKQFGIAQVPMFAIVLE